jgi:FemAB-related protein (PEP-CTERM system-associated)
MVTQGTPGLGLRAQGSGSPPVTVSTSVSAAEWDAYVARHPDATVDHLWRWREIFTGVFGHECLYLAARQGDQVTGVLPLVLFRSRLFGRSVVSLPFLNDGGVLADTSASAAALVDRARAVAVEFGAAYVELRHRTPVIDGLPVRRHKIGFSRALPATADELWAGVDRKVRNQVRKAEKEGLVATSGGGDLVASFYDVFGRNMRDLGTPVYTRRLFDETLRLFPGDARVHLVRHGGRAVAAGIAIRFRDTVLVPWASSLRAFRHLCPNMLLYWKMLEQAVADGARVFDFGRSSPGSGPQQFKRQWGAAEAPLNWQYVLVGRRTLPDAAPSSPKLRAAVAVWSRLPLWLANAAGPHIVRSIP